MTSTLRPLGNRLILAPINEVVDKIGSLWMPEQSQDRQRYRRWRVAAIGDGVRDPRLLPGIEVVVNERHAGEAVVLNDEIHRVVLESSIIAII